MCVSECLLGGGGGGLKGPGVWGEGGRGFEGSRFLGRMA